MPALRNLHEPAPSPLTLRHALGGYREFSAPPSMSPMSEALWIYRTPSEQRAATHRVLPDLSFNLVFCRQRGRPGDSSLLLLGPGTRPRLVTFAAGCEMSALRVKLEWVAPLLGLHPADHCDQALSLAAVLPGLAGPLHEKLAQTATAGAALSVLAAELGMRVDGRRARRAQLAAVALDLVRATSGRVPIEHIAGRSGFSLRYLRRCVRLHAGVSLKAYARAVRFLHAVTAADRLAEPAWARLAADHGYCDQSHFVRESRALCGLPPGRVHRERLDEAELSNPRAV